MHGCGPCLSSIGLLKAKLRGSGLEPYVEVVAHIDTETEQRLVPIYRLEI